MGEELTDAAYDAESVTTRRRSALGLLAVAIALGLAAFAAAPDPRYQPWPVIGLWAASLAAFLAGARILDCRGLSLPRLGGRELVFLVAITAIALLVRTVALDSVPWNVAGDEAENGDFARAVLRSDVDDPFSTGWAGHPTLWFFLQAGSLHLFGDDVLGLRMLAALLGTAAIPAVYLFARPAFGQQVAGAAALLLLALHVHVHYSRVGLNSGADGLLMLIALGMLVAGLRRGSLLTVAAAGASAGVAQHFYLGSRLVPFVLAALIAHQVVIRGRSRPQVLRLLPLAPVGFLVGYGPGLRVPLYHWDDFNARLAQVGVFQSGWWETQRQAGISVRELLLFQLNRSLGGITHVDDRSANYLAAMPLLDTVSSLFFLLGLGFCLAAWRRLGQAAVLLWLAGTIAAGGVLTVDSPASHRLVGVAPALCILVALGIVRTASFARTVVPRARAPIIGATIVLVAGIAAWNLNFYFRTYEPRHLYGGRQGEEITAIGHYLRERGDGGFVYFFGAPATFYDVGTIRFLAPDVPGTDVHLPLAHPSELVALPPGRRPLFLFLPGRASELAVVRKRFRGGRVQRVDSEADSLPLFVAYAAPLDPTYR